METKQEISEKLLNKQYSDTSEIQSTEKFQEEEPTFVVIPPDGGWGWIVVMGTFYALLIADGIIYAFGIFLNDMSQAFNCSKSKVALTGAIMTGFFCLSGPFISAMVNRFGYRKVAVGGSLVASISCMLTSISSSLYVTFFTHGILGGIGFGLVYVPSVIAVGFYFEKWRALATGIAVCGAGIGGIALPPILTLLIKDVGWRNTFRIMGGLSFGCTFCGLLYRPLKPVRLVNIELQERKNETDSQILDKRSFFTRFHNTSFPTLSQIHCKSRPTIMDMTVSCSADDIGTASTVIIFKPLTKNSSSEYILSTAVSNNSTNATPDFPKNLESKLSTVYETTVHEEEKHIDRCYWLCKRHKNGTSKPTLCCYKLNTNTNTRNESMISRPLYRDDIFYSASLMFLPEYRKSMYSSHGTIASAGSAKSDLEYNMLVTRTITRNELDEAKTCKICSESMKRILATMLDLSLLKSNSFLLLTLSAVFTSLGFYTPYMFIQDRAIQYRVLPKETAFWLISCIGFTNTFGRVACGILSSFPKRSAIKVSYVSLFVGGVATAFSGLSYNIWIQFGYAAIYGISVACMSTLRTIIMVDMLGLEKLTNAIGIILMFQGIASLIGTSISGFFADLTGDYRLSFYFAGGCMCIGALLLMPIKEVSTREQHKKEATTSKFSDT